MELKNKMLVLAIPNVAIEDSKSYQKELFRSNVVLIIFSSYFRVIRLAINVQFQRILQCLKYRLKILYKIFASFHFKGNSHSCSQNNKGKICGFIIYVNTSRNVSVNIFNYINTVFEFIGMLLHKMVMHRAKRPFSMTFR